MSHPWQLIESLHPSQEPAKKVKSVLYAYRVLLTGIHLMNTGQVEANLLKLNESFQLGYIDELVAMKTEEQIAPQQLDWGFHDLELNHIESLLNNAHESTALGETRDFDGVNSLLVEMRLKGFKRTGDQD